MPATGQTYVIAGAGIAGLALALGLAKFGATVLVLERQPVLQEFGAGIQISPNARHVLDHLGLDEAVAAASLEPVALDAYPHRATKPIVSMELGDIVRQRFGAPYAVMHRADLADLLHRACRRFANIDILFGVRNWDVVSHARGVTIAIDEPDGMSRTVRANAFIGADGVHSHTRRQLLDGPAAKFGHRIAWRALIPSAGVADILPGDRVSVFFGTGFHLVCYPLPHRGQINLALFLPSDHADAKTFSGVKKPATNVGKILAAADTAWTPWPLYTVETDTWHRGNVGLIGDAAHAMVPFQAQGAAMGLEDAALLAPLLVETNSAETAFGEYARLRQKRVARVAALSQQNGRIFHMPWPLSIARDMVMSAQGAHAHLRRLEWIYGYNPIARSSH